MYVNIIYMYLYIYIHFPVHNFDKFLEGSTDFVRRAGGPWRKANARPKT